MMKKTNKVKRTFNTLGESFKGYFQNINLSIPYIILLIIVIILTSILAIIPTTALTGQVGLIDAISKIFISIIFLFILLFTSSFLLSGAIGMAKEISEKKKTSLTAMLQASKKFWSRMLGVTVLIAIIISIIALVLLLLGGLISSTAQFSVELQIISLGIIALIVIAISAFLSLTPYLIVVKNLSVMEALKQSIKITKENYWEVLTIGFVFTVLWILVDMIPFVGDIIKFLIIAPAQTLGFVILLKKISK